MKTLERSELKKLMGGEGGSVTMCRCSNGTYVSCGAYSSSQCFDLVYNACGGEPASACWFVPVES